MIDDFLSITFFFKKKKEGGRYVVHSFDKKKTWLGAWAWPRAHTPLACYLPGCQRFARFFFLLVFLYSKKTLTGLIYFLVLTWFLNTIINFYFYFNSFLFNYYVFDNNNNNNKIIYENLIEIGCLLFKCLKTLCWLK